MSQIKVQLRPISTSPSDMNDATIPPGADPVYVTTLRPDDVLLGRGAPIISYEGNIKFRELVRSKKPAYMSTGRHQAKDDIAREVVLEIGRRNGRFLKKVTSMEEKDAQGKPREANLWKVAEDAVAMEKVKQALRDKERSKEEIGYNTTAEGLQQGSSRSIHPILPDPSSIVSAGLDLGVSARSGMLPQGLMMGSSILQGRQFGLGSGIIVNNNNNNNNNNNIYGPVSPQPPPIGPPFFGMSPLVGAEGDNNLLFLMQRQQAYRTQQMMLLRLQMMQNDELGFLRDQEQLRTFQILQSSLINNNNDHQPGAVLGGRDLGAGTTLSSLEGFGNNIEQRGTTNLQNISAMRAASLLPPQDHQLQFHQMRASAAAAASLPDRFIRQEGGLLSTIGGFSAMGTNTTAPTSFQPFIADNSNVPTATTVAAAAVPPSVLIERTTPRLVQHQSQQQQLSIPSTMFRSIEQSSPTFDSSTTSKESTHTGDGSLLEDPSRAPLSKRPRRH